jgi:aminomethyltransferase
MQVKNSEGEVIGVITSGTFSPTLKHGIALALVAKEISVGDRLIVDVRGRDSQSEVVKLPFVISRVR